MKYPGFAKEVREFRLKRPASQHQLALVLGVTVQTVYRWEAGTHWPQAKQIKELRRLGVKV
jgi:DNA-binding transcriptional regulator YiaG